MAAAFMSRVARTYGVVGLASLLGGWLWAAEKPADLDLVTDGLKRLGPFYLSPTAALKDVGYDDNVRLESQEKEGDMTATASGNLEAVLLAGDRGGARFSNTLDYVTFAQNTDLTHWNGQSRARGVYLMKAWSASLEDHFVSVRERPNTEVDMRLRRESNAVTAGLKSLFQSRLNVKSYVQQASIDYSTDEEVGEAEAARLTRDERSLIVSGDLQILPKTTLTADASVTRIDFDLDTEGRDSRETSFLVGLRFDPSASLQGWFTIGPEDLHLADRPGQDFSGLAGEGHLSMRLAHFARIKTTFTRGTEFSTVKENAYYVATTWTAAYEQALSRKLSGEILYGRGNNHYPQPVTTTGPPFFQGIRDDQLSTYQVGVRYRASEQMTIVARANRMSRDSTDDFHDRERNVYTVGTRYSF